MFVGLWELERALTSNVHFSIRCVTYNI